MRLIAFDRDAFEHFSSWAVVDKKIFVRIKRLIIESASDPFNGIGKPEPLRGDLHGYWSRRIDQYHRLVYKVTDDMIIIASCKYHYTNDR